MAKIDITKLDEIKFTLRRGETGLFFLTSETPELKGLMVAEPSQLAAIANLPLALLEFERASLETA